MKLKDKIKLIEDILKDNHKDLEERKEKDEENNNMEYYFKGKIDAYEIALSILKNS